jgi:hypothetical protein
LCFWWCYLFNIMWYWKCVPPFCNSHYLFTQHCCLLCSCSVNHFIPIVIILKYDYKLSLNTIIRKKFVVGICKPWANF